MKPPREAIRNFADGMEDTLKKYDDIKGTDGWRDQVHTIDYLRNMLQKKVAAFHQNCFNLEPVKVKQDCIHIANYAMMIFDRLEIQQGIVPEE